MDKETREKKCFFSLIDRLKFPYEIEELIYFYLMGLIWLRYQILRDKIKKITYDCVEKRTCWTMLKRMDSPLYSVYYFISNKNEHNSIIKRKNKNNLDAFYDQTCLSRTCGYEFKICSEKFYRGRFSISIANSDSDSPIVFDLKQINGNELEMSFLPQNYWALIDEKFQKLIYPGNKKINQKNKGLFFLSNGEFIFSLFPGQILYLSLNFNYCQILLENKNRKENNFQNQDFTWTVYKNNFLILVDHNLLQIYFLHCCSIETDEDNKYSCYLTEYFNLPHKRKKHYRWKIVNDDFHDLIFLVNENYFLQFELKI